MALIITKSINPDDQQELFAGLRHYNQQYLDAAQFGDLGVYSRDAQGVMQGGLIAKRKGNWLCIAARLPARGDAASLFVESAVTILISPGGQVPYL